MADDGMKEKGEYIRKHGHWRGSLFLGPFKRGLFGNSFKYFTA